MSIESYFLILRSTNKTLEVPEPAPQDHIHIEDSNLYVSQSSNKVYEAVLDAGFISEFDLLIRHFNMNPDKPSGELTITPELASELITILDYITNPSAWSLAADNLLKYNEFFINEFKRFSPYFNYRTQEYAPFEEHSEFEMLERVSNVMKAFLTIYNENYDPNVEIRCVYKTYYT